MRRVKAGWLLQFQGAYSGAKKERGPHKNIVPITTVDPHKDWFDEDAKTARQIGNLDEFKERTQ